jgi:hypothetical protein
MAALVVGFPFDTGEFFRGLSEEWGLMDRDSQSTLSGPGKCREVYFNVQCIQANCAPGAIKRPLQRDSRPHGTCKIVPYILLCTYGTCDVGRFRCS